MAITTINTGTTANDGTGDSIRVAFVKANDNFTFLQNSINDLVANSIVVTSGVRLEGGGLLTGLFRIRSTVLDPYYDVATTNQTFGGGTVPGITTFTNTQDSASVTTGAVIVTGGLGVSGTSTLDNITTGNIEVTRGLLISSSNAVVATGNVVAANFVLASGGQITLPSGVPLDADVLANAAAQAVSLTTLIANASTQHNEIASKAPLASPTFTGIPHADTAAAGTNTTQLATTAFVHEANVGLASHVSGTYAPLASPTLTGTPLAPTAGAGTNNTQIATTAYVDGALSSKANTVSPTFTGTPSLPTGTTGVTQTAGDNTTALATTAFVYEANVGLASHVTDLLTSKASVDSQTFTGTPSLPTGTTGVTQTSTDSSTALATTAFVHSLVTARYSTSAPTTSVGATGDKKGDFHATSTYLYVCITDYTDGLSDIWVRISVTGTTW